MDAEPRTELEPDYGSLEKPELHVIELADFKRPDSRIQLRSGDEKICQFCRS